MKRIVKARFSMFSLFVMVNASLWKREDTIPSIIANVVRVLFIIKRPSSKQPQRKVYGDCAAKSYKQYKQLSSKLLVSDLVTW